MRRLAAVVLVVVAAGAAPAAAQAHAVLVGSEPGDGVTRADAPDQVRLRFSEAVAASLSRVQLLDARGRPVHGTRLARTGDPRMLVLGLPALPRGAYQVDWDVLARDDGHRTGGSLTFGVAVPAAPAGGNAAGAAGRPDEAALRWLQFALLAVVVGGIGVSAMLPAAAAPARRRLLAAAGGSGALAALVGAFMLTRRGEAPGVLLGTRWGALWTIQVVAAGGLAAMALIGRRRAGRNVYVAALGLATALVVARSLAGHAAAAGPTAVAADAVHLFAALLWLGAVLVLALLSRPLVIAIRRPFAWTAGLSLLVLTVSGLYAAGAQVASLDALLETFYGRTLLAKLALVAAMGALGAANALALRRRRGRGRLVLVEGLVGLELLVAAALLTSSTPARGPEFAAARPAHSPPLVARAGDVLVSAGVRPNRPGANVVSLLAVSSRRPPPAAIDGVAVRLGDEPWVPLRLVAPDRWAGGTTLDRAGDARMTVLVQRAGRRLAAELAWDVAPPDRARPVVVSSRPLAPTLNQVAALILIVAACWAAWAAARARALSIRTRLEEEPT